MLTDCVQSLSLCSYNVTELISNGIFNHLNHNNWNVFQLSQGHGREKEIFSKHNKLNFAAEQQWYFRAHEIL